MDGCASDEESPLGQINSIPFGGDTFKPAGVHALEIYFGFFLQFKNWKMV